MAILSVGQISCAVCGDAIERGDEAVLFPHFVLNEKDPLYKLSDASCHAACVSTDARGQAMLRAAEAHDRNTGPGKRACAVCSSEILDPDDYFGIVYLGDPSTEPLGAFNYTHLHMSHIRDWKQADAFLALAKAAVDSGRWEGDALGKLVQDVEAGRSA